MIEFLPESRFLKPYCPRGHYKPEVGILGKSRCYACYRDYHKRRPAKIIYPDPATLRRPYCKRGHYKPEVGVRQGRCVECRKLGDRQKRANFHIVPRQQIGDQCEAVRLACGLSKIEFAKKIGVSRRTYTRWTKEGILAEPRMIKRVVPLLYKMKTEHDEAERIRLLREEASRPNLQRPFNESSIDAA